MRRTHLLFLSTLLALFAIFSQGCKHVPTPVAGAPSATTTIASKKTQTTYTLTVVPESDHEFEKSELPPAGVAAPSPENFHGTDRKAAKISISSASTQTFSDVGALLDSGLFVKDATMLHHSPLISKAATSDRVSEEQHNVVVTGFLYASTKESDNDFHCIVGMAPNQTKRLVNVEVSGLPPSGADRARIKAARDQFKEFFGDHLPGAGKYTKFNPPIKVRIAGSIFFDVDHKAGKIGPMGFRPKTAWEIHPVTDIEFEP
jgi:hypothetical protein